MHSRLNEKVVALVGSPNSGKTTLYNWLTGAKFKTVNYPGSTVEYAIGSVHQRYGSSFQVMDTPGTYSLVPRSPDEAITVEAIFRHRSFGAAALVVAVVDATQMTRGLLLTHQLKKAGFRVVVALTMQDLLVERGETIRLEQMTKQLGCPIVVINGRLGGGVQELTNLVQEKLALEPVSLEPIFMNWTADDTERAIRENAKLLTQVLEKHASPEQEKHNAQMRTERLDRWLLHPVWGLAFFFLLMATLFTSIFWVARPLMGLIDFAAGWSSSHLLALSPHSLWASFLANGMVASFGAVLVFVPQIFILFAGIVMLEDSGYLARSATIVDRPFSALGLNGRSFVPLLSAYACAVPAMMAARTITSRRERWLTLFVIPLMSCSARLPVYALLLTFLIRGGAAWKSGLLLASFYFASMFVGALASAVATRFLKKDEDSHFMLELPIYRKPLLKNVLHSALHRTSAYLRRAGPTIFVFSLLIWIATTFPNYNLEDQTARLQQSYAAKIGRVLEPVFHPMGGDWRVGVGLISAFAAREVFVSSMAIVFNVTEKEESSLQNSLIQKMDEAKQSDGYPLFTLSSVVGLVIFFMIAMQCLSTFSMAVRESGSWGFAIFQLIVFNLVAYICAVAAVQGLRALGFA